MRFLKIDENYALKAAKRRGKTPNQAEWILSDRPFLVAEISGWPFADLSQLVKVKAKKTFHISKKPVVAFAEDEQSHTLGNGSEFPRFHGPPRLLAVARDPWTIFAYWNVDWRSIFKNAAPIDRQVHLRIHCADGLEEKEVAVEPMAGTHYIKMSHRHRACRIEIGYYQPADVWNSVAKSNEVVIPPAEISEAEDVDLATIPFHLSFQQLVELYGANSDALTTVISRFQTRAANRESQNKLSSNERQILRRTGTALSEVADARRAFNQMHTKKLKRDLETFLGLGTTSPSRGFSRDWTSGGS